MEYVKVNGNLVIKTNGSEDIEFLADLEMYSCDVALSTLCDVEGWVGNQGPQPIPCPGLSEAPTLALGVEYDEDGRVRYSKAYAYLDYQLKDWREVLLNEGQITFKAI